MTQIAREIRKIVLKTANKARSPHIGSALSCVDILSVLYFKVLNLQDYATRDIFILSKAHAAMALYATLALKNIIPMEALDKYLVDGGVLPCHIDMQSANGLEASTGSLGHGLGIAEGFVLSNRLKNINSRIFVIIGDGEFQEGSIMEALNSIGSLKLNEITVILDNNKFQASAATKDVADVNNYEKIFSAFGFDVESVDGHNVDLLTKALNKKSQKPTAIIANTLKGKGFSFMEGTLESHYIKIDDEKMKIGLTELENV